MQRSTLLIAMIFIALLGAMAATPMLERPPQHSIGKFNAVRAKSRLAYLLGDQRPHPADSAADDAVRARLVTLLQGMGIKPIVRDQLACNELFKRRGVACARVRNVIAIVGPRSGNAVLLNAHYDSVEAGPGASDDGIGVATLLEVASILKDRPLKRPVLLLFNEGEELGLVGARAFLADPLSRNVDSLINLEARGVEGPVNMFETSRPNAAAIELYASAVAHPVANSLSNDVYRLLPNYTDVNSFAERGWLTLNLAPIGNETRYHSPGDDIAAVNQATLRHMGDQTLALAEAMASAVPRESKANRIFMDLTGRSLVSMPLTAGVVLLALLLLGFGLIVRRRGGFERTATVALGTIAGSGFLAWLALALALVGAARHGMFWRAFPLWTHLATYACVLLLGSGLLATIGRGASVRQLRAAFWLLFLMIGAIIGLAAPGGIIFFLFPPLLALIGMAGARWWRSAETVAAAAAIMFLYVTWGALLGLLQELINGGPMWVLAPFGALLIVPVLIETKPLIDGVTLRAAAVPAVLLFVIGWGAAAAAPAYSADRQQRFVIQHLTDATANKSYWSVINDGAPLVRGFGAAWRRGKIALGDRVRWLAPAPADSVTRAPGLKLVSQIRHGDERTLTLRLAANGNDDIDLLAPEDSQIRSAGVTGFIRPIDQDEEGKYSITCSGRSCDGLVLEVTTRHASPIRALLIGSRANLPASAAPLLKARPKFARPQYNEDERIAFTRVSL